MNQIVNKFLLAGDKFMPGIYLRRPDLNIVLVDNLLKTKKEYKNLKKQEISRYINQNELGKACFQHDIIYGRTRRFNYDLTRRTASDKILRDKAFNIVKNLKYDGYQRSLASIVYKCFDKKSFGSDIKNQNISNKELAEELQKPIIRKFKKRKVQSPLIENIWGADLADMLLISKLNKGIRFL